MHSEKDAIKSHAKQLFEHLKNPWPDGDRWSVHTRTSIENFVGAFARSNAALSSGAKILNVGSHGNAYGINVKDHVHVDVAASALSRVPLACVADAEALPFPDRTFDVVLCVGSVINYCSASAALKEMGRVIKPNGWLLLEFETSESLEFSGTSDFGKDATIVKTFYNGALENIYVYSYKYIAGALAANDLRVVDVRRFHIFSPFFYRITRSERFASLFAVLDRFTSRWAVSRKYSANFLVSAKNNGDEL